MELNNITGRYSTLSKREKHSEHVESSIVSLFAFSQTLITT